MRMDDMAQISNGAELFGASLYSDADNPVDEEAPMIKDPGSGDVNNKKSRIKKVTGTGDRSKKKDADQ